MSIINLLVLHKRFLLAILFILFLGMVNLPHPFHGDQALFAIGAESLSEGKVLYRDFWDLKQPGIYFFYSLAGLLFGFNEVGVHFFELLYMLAFSITLLVTLKGYFKNEVVLYFVPLLTIGFYYIAASTWHLTQLEALVGFPIFLSLYFAYRGVECSHRRKIWFFFLSGLMGGVVILFKLMFLILLFPFWASSLLYLSIKRRRAVNEITLRVLGGVGLGLFISLLPVAIYFYFQGSLSVFYTTSFIYPPQISSRINNVDILRFFKSLFWFIRSFAPIIILVSLGLYLSPKSYKDFISVNLIAWFILGLLITWIQRHAWWQYHYLILLVPTGILAAKSIDIFWADPKGRNLFFSSVWSKLFLLLVILLACLPSSLLFGKKFVSLISSNFAILSQDRKVYQGKLNPDYSRIARETSFLSAPGTLSGEIFVFGDPLVYFLSGRRQAVSINGWSPELFLPHQWDELKNQLKVARPPYIFVDRFYIDLIRDESSNLARFLSDSYSLFHVSESGDWYKSKI